MSQNERITTTAGPQSKDRITKLEAWKSIGIKVKVADLPALNQRIHLYGYDSLGKLVKDFVEGSFPPITEDRQIQRMDANLQQSGLQTALDGYWPDCKSRFVHWLERGRNRLSSQSRALPKLGRL